MLKTAEKKRTQSFTVIDSNDNYQSNSFSSSNLSSSSSSSSSSSTTNKSFDALIYNESYPTKCNTLLDLLNTSKDILNQFKNEIANGYNFQYPFPINCIEYGRRNNDRAVNSGVITSMFNSTLNKPNQNLFRQKVKDLLKANNHSSKSPEDLKPKLSLLNLDMKMPDTSSAEDVVKGLDPTAIDKLMDKKFASILKRTDNLIVRISDKSSKVLVAGDVNAGKSTFVNTLLRREVMPVDQQPCTTLFCEVLGVHENDDVEEVHAIKDIKLYDRKDRSTYTVMDLDSIPNVMNSEVQQYSLLKVYCKDRRQAQNSLLHNGIIDIALIDCPGLNRDTLKTTALFARQEEIDVIIFVVSAENHFTLSAKEFLSNASNEKAYLFIVVNRFDNIKNKSKCKRLVLEQIKEVSPRTFENAKDLVHFVSASAVEIPAGDGIVTVVEDSSDDDDSIKQFNSCEEALRSFIVEKRTNSKLAPAQHFLENLVLDISLLSELNLDHALQEHKRAAMELEERKFDYEKLVEDEKRVTEKAGRMIDDYCEGVTRLCGQQVREAIRNVNKDIKIEFPGFFSVWNYATDVRDAMLDKILEQIRNSESYSIHATHECIAKLRSMGENLPDDNRNTEVDVDSMFSNVNRSLNIPVEISDFVDLDFHEKFNSGLLNVAGLTGASLIAFGSNAKTLHSLLKFSNILSVYNMRKVILPVLGLASIGFACYLVLDIQNTIPRKVSRKIQKVLEQENYVDKQMNRIARQVRKKSRLVSNDLLFRYRLAVEREKKQRESLIHVVDKSQEALLFFEQILCSSEKMANILSDFDKI